MPAALSGFSFAAKDVTQVTEMADDYRYFLASADEESFNGAATGEKITGLSWQESSAQSTRALTALLG